METWPVLGSWRDQAVHPHQSGPQDLKKEKDGGQGNFIKNSYFLFLFSLDGILGVERMGLRC